MKVIVFDAIEQIPVAVELSTKNVTELFEPPPLALRVTDLPIAPFFCGAKVIC